jgi:hypothetical protein
MSPSGKGIPILMKALVGAGIATAAAQGRNDDKEEVSFRIQYIQVRQGQAIPVTDCEGP